MPRQITGGTYTPATIADLDPEPIRPTLVTRTCSVCGETVTLAKVVADFWGGCVDRDCPGYAG